MIFWGGNPRSREVGSILMRDNELLEIDLCRVENNTILCFISVKIKTIFIFSRYILLHISTYRWRNLTMSHLLLPQLINL